MAKTDNLFQGHSFPEILGYLSFVSLVVGLAFSVGQSIVIGGAYFSTFTYIDYVRNALFALIPFSALIFVYMFVEVIVYSPLQRYYQSISLYKGSSIRDKILLNLRPVGYLLIPISVVLSVILISAFGKSRLFLSLPIFAFIIGFAIMRAARGAMFRSEIIKDIKPEVKFEDFVFSKKNMLGLSVAFVFINFVFGFSLTQLQLSELDNSRYTMSSSSEVFTGQYVASNSNTIVIRKSDSYLLLPRRDIETFEHLNPKNTLK